jgi:AcrR family transcriptional regulator
MLVTNIWGVSKTEHTRRRLQQEAIRLFTERGFDEVTVEEVARAAGVSHMTFFRHFPTKESVVLDDPYDPLIGAAIADQDRSLPPLERARRGVLDAWEDIDEPGDDMTRARVVLAAAHPALRAKVWENNQATEHIIVEALTRTGANPLDARVAAGTVLGAITAALFDWAGRRTGDSLGDRVRYSMRLLAPAEVAR